MPLYLSKYIGSGTHADPYRPVGSDQPGWSAIDLRPNGGATLDGGGLNLCLLSLPVAHADSRLYQLASGFGERIPLTVRAGMAARLNTTISYTRFDDVVAQLMLYPPANGWKPIQNRVTKPIAIYLGGLLSPNPAMRPLAAKVYRETWSTADSASLTSDLTWTEFSGSNLTLTSNRCQVTGNVARNDARAEVALDTDDVHVEVQLTSWNAVSVNLAFGVLGRKDSSSTQTYYDFSLVNNSGTEYRHITKLIAGVETELSTKIGAYLPNETIALEVEHSTITGFRNGSIWTGPVTDTAITSGRYAGVWGYSDSASNTATGDNWMAKDVSPVSSRVSRLTLLGVG